jgi:AcrR family transcriptional regulator
MPAGERTSMQRGGTPGARAARKQPAPLYKRLPHGPHRLDRREVALNQRARIHGAMIEAVARSGYEETSVKQVIALAGVSRRSFYEHFANREACFLATFDAIAGRGIRRVTRAYLAQDGGLEERLGAAFTELSAIERSEPKAAALVAWEAQAAGAAGLARVRTATGACEQLLARGFGEAREAGPLPTPIARGIAGGLQGIVTRSVRPGGETADEDLAAKLLAWTLSFRGSGVTQVAERMRATAARRLAAGALRGAASSQRSAPPAQERARLLESVLRLAGAGVYGELTAPQIAEEANVPLETFFALHPDRDACFMAALEMLGEQLLAIAAEDALDGRDWAQAVRAVLGAVLGHLAASPLCASTIAETAFAAGRAPLQRNLQIAEALALRLTANAPGGPAPRAAVEGIAGALWHTVGCQVAAGRSGLLPLLSDHLTFVVLAPCIGADGAAEALAREASG